ncbi:hypothetical protein HYU50_00650 [Candidatus Woesearchaeota archaeon]|nr:hypothetical protein [Candidatus Woesearchaeota archaeon]
MRKELITSKLKSLAKGHFYIGILFLVSIFFFFPLLGSERILDNMHYINDMTFQSENMRVFLHENGAFPLWTPYFYAGQPFIAIPEHYLFDLNFIYILIFNDIFLSMNLAVISYFFIAGLGMYLLVYEMIRKQNAAFIASLIFMFNGLVQRFALTGHLNILESYALMPFAFLFVYRALHKKNWINNCIIAAVFLSMMIYAGGIIFFLYTGLISGLFMIWNLISGNFGKNIVKTVLISLVILVVLFGLSALKLLPVLEFTGISNRSAGVSFEEYLGNPIKTNNLWNQLVNLSYNKDFAGSLGILAFALLLLGLLSFKKKNVLFSILIIVLSILMASGTFIADFFYKLPGFGQTRHIERALVLFVFVAPVIAAYGFINLVNIIKNHKKDIKEWAVFSGVVALLAVEIFFSVDAHAAIKVVKPKDIPIINEISKDAGQFRIATYALSTPIGASGYNYYTQLGIPEVKGGGGIWVSEYAQYLAIAQQYAPSKMYGILNGKYLISDKEINDSGLLLKGTFQTCGKCAVWEAYGPYLYENKNSVSRAFLVSNSVLLIGNDNDKRSVAYTMIIESLDPLSSVIIEGKDLLSEYTINELEEYNAIILLGSSVDQNDVPLLQAYKDKGGKILPRVLEGENEISRELIEDALKSEKKHKEIEIKQISINEYAVELNGEKGWLVLSEKFSSFPGWKAAINSKELKMHKADNVITAVYLNGEQGKLVFRYYPESFKKGKIITIATVLILLVYIVYIIYLKKWQK